MNGFLMFLIAIDAANFNTNENSSGYKKTRGIGYVIVCIQSIVI